MGTQVTVTLAVKGEQEKALWMDAGEAALLGHYEGRTVNLDGKPFKIDHVALRLGTLGATARCDLRIEGRRVRR